MYISGNIGGEWLNGAHVLRDASRSSNELCLAPQDERHGCPALILRSPLGRLEGHERIAKDMQCP